MYRLQFILVLCTGAFMEKRLVNIEKKLEDMSSTYQRDMQSLMSSLEKVKSAVAGSGNPLKYTSQSAPALMTHHEKTVAGALKTITCDSVEKLSAMDTVLQNDNIACSLVCEILSFNRIGSLVTKIWILFLVHSRLLCCCTTLQHRTVFISWCTTCFPILLTMKLVRAYNGKRGQGERTSVKALVSSLA